MRHFLMYNASMMPSPMRAAGLKETKQERGGAWLYFAAVFRFGAVSAADLEKVPSVHGRLLPLLRRLRAAPKHFS